MSDFDLDVAIVGAGPSGIAAATALMGAGIGNVTLFEREASIGGIARHTHHPSFGLLVFRRPLSGPQFIRRIVRRCPDLRVETSATVTAIAPDGGLDIATASGVRKIRPRHLILATGARETPRHPRLVPGLRPSGITTTGALQQFIYGAGLRPFSRPVIVGTELVGFSALWTLRHAGIRALAMVEPAPRISAYRPAAALARILGVPIHLSTRIADIAGGETLERIALCGPGGRVSTLACDGLIFSGRFVGENSLARDSHLGLDPRNRIVRVDQNWLSTDPRVSAIGNAVHPADMGDRCYLEGLAAGAHVARILAGRATVPERHVPVDRGPGVRLVTPSILRREAPGRLRFDLAFHVSAPYRGRVRVSRGERVLLEQARRCLPGRRIVLRNLCLPADPEADARALAIRVCLPDSA